jgi:hypothetical protein
MSPTWPTSVRVAVSLGSAERRPAPWDLYRFTYTRVVGLSTAEPTATLWHFDGV